MKTSLITTFLSVLILFFWSCTTKKESSNSIAEKRISIEMKTDYGIMIIELYNETPLHRDNFVKLAKEGAFDSLLFHRVIETFMIQGGDPDSRNTKANDTLGRGSLDYNVDAEIISSLFHKKGALAAARKAVGNLKRVSSSMQFYIVQGTISNDSLLTVYETFINEGLAEHYFKNDSTNKPLIDSLQKAIDDNNIDQYRLFKDSIKSSAKAYVNFVQYTIPEPHREVYKSVGGAPYLDQNYTVFGEVIEGLEVVDSIAAVQTDSLNHPITDVRIQTVRVLE